MIDGLAINERAKLMTRGRQIGINHRRPLSDRLHFSTRYQRKIMYHNIICSKNAHSVKFEVRELQNVTGLP